MELGGLRTASARETDSGRADNRAQNTVLGAILVFAILILFIGILQVSLIPSANKEVEFQHSQDVQNQFQSLGANVEQASATAQTQTATIKAGVRYPPRLIFLNPAPVSGTIRTNNNPTDEFSIANAEAQNAETADYWDASAGSKSFSTKSLEYRVDYNEYDENPKLIYENSITYSQFETENILREEQDIINGRSISLTSLSGELSESQTEAQTVTARPLSPAQTTVPVTDAGSPIILSIRTSLSENRWKEILADETTGSGGHITSISCPAPSPSEPCTGPLMIELETGVTYNLQMAKVGVGSGASEPGAHYLTNLQGDDETILDTGSTKLVVQVRDRFNNPVSGVAVPFEIPSGEGKFKESGGDTTTVTTDENGRAQVTYVAGDSPGTFAIEAGSDVDGEADFISPGDEPQENTEFEVTVVEASDEAGDIGASINPSGPLQLESAFTNGEAAGSGSSIECYPSGGGSGPETCLVKFTIRNDGSETYEIDQFRYFYYSSATNPGSREPGIPDKIWVTGEPGSGPCEVHVFQDQFGDTATNIDSIDPGGQESIIIEFRKGTNHFETVAGESFGLAMKYSNTNTGETLGSTYLISPQLDTSGSEIEESDAPPDSECLLTP